MSTRRRSGDPFMSTKAWLAAGLAVLAAVLWGVAGWFGAAATPATSPVTAALIGPAIITTLSAVAVAISLIDD